MDPNQVVYKDYNDILRQQSKLLKEEHHCDVVIALNHMRLPEDNDMAAKNSSEVVDLILGGHDHCYYSELNEETGVYVLKSGTDFEVFTNMLVLFEVEPDDFEAFKSKVEAHPRSQFVSLRYSKAIKRVFLTEKVYITEEFTPD